MPEQGASRGWTLQLQIVRVGASIFGFYLHHSDPSNSSRALYVLFASCSPISKVVFKDLLTQCHDFESDMACSLSAARRTFVIALRSRPYVCGPASRAYTLASPWGPLIATCTRSFSSTRLCAADGLDNDTPSDPVGQMEYASADDEQANSDHALPDTESSKRSHSKTSSIVHFQRNLSGIYRKESHSHGDILMLQLDDNASSDKIKERIAKLVGALRSPIMTKTSGLEVARGVCVLNHRSNSSRPTGSREIALQVEFRRTSKGNSLNQALMRNLINTFKAIETIKGISAVVLTAAPLASGRKCFSAGADINTMAALKNRREAANFIKLISELCTAIRGLSVPVVAVIEGPCIGAGLEVAASCDMRVATSSASFSMPEVLLGIPSVVEARLLCDIVGWGRARHLMFTGCTWSASEALQAGLISQLFQEDKDLSTWIASFIATGNSTAHVYRAQKALMRKWEDLNIDEGIKAGVSSFADRFEDPELRNRVTGLIGKRLKLGYSFKRLDLGAGGPQENAQGSSNRRRNDKSTSVDPREDQLQ